MSDCMDLCHPVVYMRLHRSFYLHDPIRRINHKHSQIQNALANRKLIPEYRTQQIQIRPMG